LSDKICHLTLVATDGEVGDGPGGLLLCLELSLAQVTNDHGHQTGLNDRLHLLLVTCSDVRQEPNCLLQHLILILNDLDCI